MHDAHPHMPPAEPESLVPPNDLDAEAAVLSAILLNRTASAVTPILNRGDFFSADNATVFDALVSLETEGKPLDILTLKSRLADTDKLRQIGGTKYLAQLVDATPSEGNVEAHARIVSEKARLRRVIAMCQRVSAQGYLSSSRTAEFIEQALADIQWAAKDTTPSKSLFQWEGTEEIMGELPPIRWVCRDLCIGPGRPTLVQGYGFSGKTMVLQSFALAIAAGLPAFGYFRVVQGRVLHVDYEQGKHATKRRYQRMAFAMKLTADDLGDRLQLTCFPAAYLTDTGIEARLTQECAGVAVCIIDSFRAAIPGQDENESTVRQFLDMLTRISEATGCSFIVIHHSGKGGKEKDSREKSRGSSSIFDACGTVIDLQASKPFEPVKVSLVKASASNEGKPPEPFFVAFRDVADNDGNDMRAGLLVEHQTAEQVEQPLAGAPAARFESVRSKVLDFIRANPGAAGVEWVARRSALRVADVRGAMKELESEKVIVNLGTVKRPRYSASIVTNNPSGEIEE